MNSNQNVLGPPRQSLLCRNKWQVVGSSPSENIMVIFGFAEHMNDGYLFFNRQGCWLDEDLANETSDAAFTLDQY